LLLALRDMIVGMLSAGQLQFVERGRARILLFRFRIYDLEPGAGWITMGFHQDLHEASMIALEAMLTLMYQQYKLARRDAMALASVVVDLRVTQLVNGGVRGVHAVLPDRAFQAC
jgi:acetamidase/formamidase